MWGVGKRGCGCCRKGEEIGRKEWRQWRDAEGREIRGKKGVIRGMMKRIREVGGRDIRKGKRERRKRVGIKEEMDESMKEGKEWMGGVMKLVERKEGRNEMKGVWKLKTEKEGWKVERRK